MAKHHWDQFEVRTQRVRKTRGRPMHSTATAVSSPSDVRNLFLGTADTLTQECMWGIYVDGRNQVLGIQELYRGTATGTSVRIGEIIAPALRLEACGVIVVHNHPSGLADASEEDLEVTTDIRLACELMDIQFLDHVILGSDSAVVSIRREHGDLWGKNADDSDLFTATPDQLKQMLSAMRTQ